MQLTRDNSRSHNHFNKNQGLRKNKLMNLHTKEKHPENLSMKMIDQSMPKTLSMKNPQNNHKTIKNNQNYNP